MITPLQQKEEVLYFSSNGLINVGGLDIYRVTGGLKAGKINECWISY